MENNFLDCLFKMQMQLSPKEIAINTHIYNRPNIYLGPISKKLENSFPTIDFYKIKSIILLLVKYDSFS